MPLLILASLISFIPFIAIYRWLKNNKKEDQSYQLICDDAFKKGLISVLPIILVSGIFFIVVRVTGLHKSNPLLYEGIYNFIVLALAEEIVKFVSFKMVLRKNSYPYSWLDIVSLMVIVSCGFALIEAVTYAIGASIPVVLIRGICVPHAGYGYITGYFYGKGLKTGNKFTKWFGFCLSWFIHGLYDFSLSEEFIALSEYLMLVALLLAVLDIVLVFRLIRFVRKARKSEVHTEPLTVIE